MRRRHNRVAKPHMRLPPVRAAANPVVRKFILDCLRVYATRREIVHCIDHLKTDAILEIAPDVEELAETLGLIQEDA